MQIKKTTVAAMTLNAVLAVMVAYIVGVEVGKNTVTDVEVDQVAINHAVYLALKEQ